MPEIGMALALFVCLLLSACCFLLTAYCLLFSPGPEGRENLAHGTTRGTHFALQSRKPLKGRKTHAITFDQEVGWRSPIPGTFGQRTGTWDDHSVAGWVGWDVYFSYVAGQRLNMGGSSAYIDHADAVGTTTMVTDPAGNAVWDLTRGPWGQLWQQGGTRPSGVFGDLDWQINDPLQPSATREYSNRVFRWMTPDPGGRKVVKLNDPQTWNMYAYVGNNPISRNDPSGLNACDPKDKSQSDCSVSVVITDRIKDKSGNYNDQFKGVKGEKHYNAIARVFANDKLKGTYLIKTTPSSGRYGTVKAGTYTGTRFRHKGKYPAILLRGEGMPKGEVPAMGGRDPFTGKSYISGAEIHMSGYGFIPNNTGFTTSGRPISMGCSVIACSEYQSFESATGLNAPAPQTDFEIILGATANGGGQ